MQTPNKDVENNEEDEQEEEEEEKQEEEEEEEDEEQKDKEKDKGNDDDHGDGGGGAVGGEDDAADGLDFNHRTTTIMTGKPIIPHSQHQSCLPLPSHERRRLTFRICLGVVRQSSCR